jgi:2'-5' RNA ligase
MEIRLFAGIPLSSDVLEQFQDFMEYHLAPPRLKWTKPSNLHVTTCFIGNVEEENVASIKEKIAAVAEGSELFELMFEKFQFAPKRRPSMIWARFQKHDAFTQLSERLHQALGVEDKHKDPIPHVTMARFKGKVYFDLQSDSFLISHLPVSEIVLWRSVLSAKGATYHEQARFPLRQ